MGAKMNALAVTELGQRAELCEMPRPSADANSVVVKTAYSGVSAGTEMWIAYGRRADYGPPPFVNGYQATGHIAEIGPGVEGFAERDTVAVFCRGAHSEYVKASAHLVHKLPDSACLQPAALFVQPSVGANALNHAGVNTGDTVLITGQGLIGQCTALLARLRGAYVAASDISAPRLQSSARCADWVIDVGKTPLVEAVKSRFPEGFDVVIESTGFQALVDDAMRCCREGGRFVFEGWYPDNISYHFNIPHARQLRVFHPCFIGPRASQEGVIRLITGGYLPMQSLISHTPRWRQSAELYNQLFTDQRDQFNGIVIDWTTD